MPDCSMVTYHWRKPMGWFGLAELLILGLLADGLFRRLGVPGLIGMLAVGLLLGQ